MQQVAEWLEKLGLGQYAQRFAENDNSFRLPQTPLYCRRSSGAGFTEGFDSAYKLAHAILHRYFRVMHDLAVSLSNTRRPILQQA
jgi:hypothetical protein